MSEELELKRLELEAEHRSRVLDQQARLAETRAGVQKVIYGTMIVGVVAAAFPFLIALAELATSEKIERIKADAQLSVVERETALKRELAETEAALARATNNHERLESLAREGRAEDIGPRIVLAQYYAHLAVDEKDRARWRSFLGFLETLQRQEAEAQVRVAAADPDSDDRAEAARRLATIQEITRPSSVLAPDGRVAELQSALDASGACEGTIYADGLVGPATLRCMSAATGVSRLAAQELLRRPEGVEAAIAVLGGRMDARELEALADRLATTPEAALRLPQRGAPDPPLTYTPVDVVMLAPGREKIAMIKEVRAVTGLGLAEAKALVEAPPPAVLLRAAAPGEAAALRDRLQALGAEVAVRPSDGARAREPLR